MKYTKYLKKKQLKKRFRKKLQTSRTAGLDGVSPEKFAKCIDEEVKIIRRKVKNFSYSMTPFKEKYILKGKNSPPRTVHIPTVRDRLVLDALNIYLNDGFKEQLEPHKKSVQQIISEILTVYNSEKFDSFLKFDVKNFFPSIDHDILISKLKEKITEKTALSVIRKTLHRSEHGIAQGLSVAGTLANIYLNQTDNEFINLPNLRYFRFVDDILILCNEEDASSIRVRIEDHMERLKLELHSLQVGGKSEIGKLKEDKLEYLGFTFHKEKISVRPTTVEKLRKRIRSVFLEELEVGTTPTKHQLQNLHRKLNLKITGCFYDGKTYGWLFFFSQINDLTLLYHLDWFVKQTFKSFRVEFQPEKVKSFVKAYYYMKGLQLEKLDKNSYIPSFSSEDTEHENLISIGAIEGLIK
ncbi:reverse transcriptase domain-containing protein [Alteromonas macleodii]|uniref:reverse transcriptase domain-containing protein n=1 Tax=Alteromonas macleodii TaxID=28108 RepID=UPI0031403AAD